jgi:fucose permease
VTAALSPASTDRRFDLLGLGTFVIVGLPDGMLGTAWPAMRHSFGVPVGDLGLILLVNTIGSVVVAAFVGRLIQRLGVSVLLAVAGFVILGAALAGVFPALIATTPQRIGDQRARHAIAWQVGAAAAGGSGTSALIGLLIDTTSLAIVGPAILTLALLLVLANSALARLAPIPVPDGPRH